MAEKGETLEDSRRLDVPSGGCSGRLPIDLDKGRARHVSRLPVDGGDDGVHQGLKVRDDPHRHGSNRIGLAHGFGTNLSDLFSHSWRRVPVSSRCWIPKHSRWASSVFSLGEVKSTDLGLGARVVRRVQEPEPFWGWSSPMGGSSAQILRGSGSGKGDGSRTRKVSPPFWGWSSPMGRGKAQHSGE